MLPVVPSHGGATSICVPIMYRVGWMSLGGLLASEVINVTPGHLFAMTGHAVMGPPHLFLILNKPRDSTPSSHLKLGFPRQPLYFSKKLFPLYPSCVLFLMWQIQMRWSYGDLVLHFGKHPSHNALQEDGQNYLTYPWQQHRRNHSSILPNNGGVVMVKPAMSQKIKYIYYSKYNIYTHIYYWEYIAI